MSSKAFKNKGYTAFLDTAKLVIYGEQGAEPALYHPHVSKDIDTLCKETGLHLFIPDTKKHYPSLMLFRNKRYNLGVVTEVDLKKNQIICEYLGETASLNKETTPGRVKKYLLKHKLINDKMSPEKVKELVDAEIKRITHYAFEVKANTDINDSILAHNKRSLAGFINHNGTDPNVLSDIVKNVIYYKAARNIRKGEQLTIDYGTDYDYPDHLYYIPSSENHLSPAAFLAEHIRAYHTKPIQLSVAQQDILQTDYHYIILPTIVRKLLQSKLSLEKSLSNITKDDMLDVRLPIYAFDDYKTVDGKTELTIPLSQLNITALMYACMLKNADAVKALIKNFKLDVFAKTCHDIDTLIIAIKASENEEQFLSFAKPLITKIVKTLDRTDSLGSDDSGKTALHLLVEKQWCKAIRMFDNSIFFDVVDAEAYDPLISAIAHGKTKALAVLLKLSCVKKSLYELLFSEDETKKDYVMKRALLDVPSERFDTIQKILMDTVKRRHSIKHKLEKFFKKVHV